MKHTVIYFLSRLVTGSFGLLSIYMLTRLLTTDEYKNYAILIAIVTFISGISYQWLVISSSRLLLEYQERRNDFIKSIIILFSFSSLLVALLVLISTYIYPDVTHDKYILLVLIVFVLGLHTLFIQLVNIVQKPFMYSLLSSLRSITSLLIAMILIYYFNTHEVGALIGFGVGFLFSAIFFIFYFKKPIVNVISSLKYKTNYQMIPLLVNYGVPLSFTYLAIMILNVSDRLMLAKMSTALAVTTYSVTYDFIQQTIGVLMNLFFLSYFPKILTYYTNKNEQNMIYTMQLLHIILLAISCFMLLFIYLYSENIAAIMFGKDLVKISSNIMPILVVSMALASYKSFYLDIIFQLQKRTDIQLNITIIIALTNISANFILIPKYGVHGAVYSTVISFTIGALASWFYGKKLFNIQVSSFDSFKILIATFFTGLVMKQINIQESILITTLIFLLISLGIYIICLIILNLMGLQKKILNLFRYKR